MPHDSRDEDLPDNDPTDELPILVETAVLDPDVAAEALRPVGAPAQEEATGEHTVRFELAAVHERHEELELLQRDFEARGARIESLEADLERLSSRWLDVERQLGERDAAIARLEESLATAQRSLAERAQAEQQLVATVAERDAQLRELDTELARERVGRAAQDAALAEQRERATRLDTELAREREARAEQETAAAEQRARAAQLETELALEREARAALEAAAAEQRERGARLDTELAAARDALSAAQAELAAERAKPPPSTDERVRVLQEELSALSHYVTNRRARWEELETELRAATARIAELERELDHRAERQRAAEELARNENERAEALRRELVDASRALASRQRELAERQGGRDREADRVIDTLKAELAEVEAELARARQLNARLQSELGTAAEKPAPPLTAAEHASALEILAHLETELEHKRSQVVVLSVEARDNARAAEAAKAELEDVRSALDAVRAELAKRNAEIGRLEEALQERERVLDARNERLSSLQREVDLKLAALHRATGADAARERDVRRSARGEVSVEVGMETPTMICLTCEPPRQYSLTRPMMTIGRSSQCDIQVPTHFVSREHARLVIDRSRVVIEDLGSTNGVFVNSVRVDRHELRHGDLVTVGETQFRFLERMAH